MIDPLFLLILGHFFGDFAFQTDTMAAKKHSSVAILTLHVSIYTVTIAFFLGLALILAERADFLTLSLWGLLALIFVTHWLQDYIKPRHFNGSRQGFYFDQALHLSLLFVVRLIVFPGQ